MEEHSARLLVFSTLFPSKVQPGAGLFIRERMFRVGKHIPLVVVSPVPWFPFQGLIRHFKPGYRLQPPKIEEQAGIMVYHPRFLAVPGVFRSLDGLSMAMCSLYRMMRLKRSFNFNLIDAHFAWPDGYAGTLIGKWLKVPVSITLRGTEVPLSKKTWGKRKIMIALDRATRVFSVADSLKRHVVSDGALAAKIRVVGNGVDSEKFYPLERDEVRRSLGISLETKVMISVGGLVERKGFQRVIEIMPEIIKQYPNLLYLIVGGPCPEGDIREALEQQVLKLGIADHVRFMGALPAEELRIPLSASNVFVLATSNEGWANVFLEAMACGLPVVTTDVGGNKEVICSSELGIVVEYYNAEGFQSAIQNVLEGSYCTEKIIRYAKVNSWESRVTILVNEFRKMVDH